MPIDDSLKPDNPEEHTAAGRLRALIQAGTESPVTGLLDRDYFVKLKRKLWESAAKS